MILTKRNSFMLVILTTLMICLTVNAKPFEELSKGCRAEDGYFQCENNSSCVLRSRVRDGRKQCDDSSDENVEPLVCSDDEVRCRASLRCLLRRYVNTRLSCQVYESTTLPCRFNEFQCQTGRTCIPRWMVKDGNEDCHTMLLQDTSDELEGFNVCLDTEFRCNASTNSKSRCIPRDWVMDGYVDCQTGNDEWQPLAKCNSKSEFRCESTGRCVPRYRVFDGFSDCVDGSDEKQSIQCFPDEEFKCHDSGRCIPRSRIGNGIVDCKDGSDEVPQPKNATCLKGEFCCHNGKRCIPTYLLCDGLDHCGDCSDEIESCTEPRMYRCPAEPETCLYWGASCDTYIDCANGTDDITGLIGFKCFRNHAAGMRYCSIPQWMLHDEFSNCDDDSDLCFSSNATSACSRCLDGKTVLAVRQICDGIVDCPDFSDECLCLENRASSQVQHFCSQVSYSGDTNEYGCQSGTLWCAGEEECLVPASVCDGRVNCPTSKIDEDLCTFPNAANSSVEEFDFICDPLNEDIDAALSNSDLSAFVKIFSPKMAKRCDGITECRNFEDECGEIANCSIRLPICDAMPLIQQVIPPGFYGLTDFINVTTRQCSGFLNFAFGKSICNGVVECSDEVDERNCSDRRFECDAGTIEWPTGEKKVVNIALDQRCDGKLPTECVDKSDELDCSDSTHFYCENGEPLFVRRNQVLDGKQDCSDYSDECPQNVFSAGGISSREELIKSPILRVLVWFMAFFALFGNVTVAGQSIKKLRKRRLNRRSKVAVVNDCMIFNLCIADFLMGVVLLTIAIKSLLYKGKYCLVDKSWRTSTLCTVVGVLTVLSSQASVFTLVMITSYRLYTVLKPMESKMLRIRVVGAWFVAIWSVALGIALFPTATFVADDMVTKAWISASPFFPSDTVTLPTFQQFAYRITALSPGKTSPDLAPSDWYGIEQHLHKNFDETSPQVKGYFGYYSESGVCIPKLYIISQEDEGLNPMTLAVMTFNCVALLYILVAYAIIYKRSTARKITVSSRQSKSQVLHRKITLLIATDVACWLPLCLMTFLSMGKVVLPPETYALSAIVFLPINSALNPLIYTNPLPILLKPFSKIFEKVQTLLWSKNSENPPSVQNPPN